MDHIELQIEEGVAVIRMNRPEKLNVFNKKMAHEMQESLDLCADDPAVRAILITGTGKGFSAGQDLAELQGPDAPTMSQILSQHYNPIIARIRDLAKPVVGGVNGVAAGAGANIALSCDIVVATSSASFIQAFSRIGLIPDSGGTFILPRLIGWQKASALMMLGDKISAADAEKLGMIYAVFPDEDYETKLKSLMQTLAGMPTKALGLTKYALNYSFTNSYEQQLQLEDRLQQEAAMSQDYKEGVEAFIQKRKPLFKGE